MGRAAQDGASVDVHDSLGVLDDAANLALCDLIVPIRTMGELSDASRGEGLAGRRG